MYHAIIKCLGLSLSPADLRGIAADYITEHRAEYSAVFSDTELEDIIAGIRGTEWGNGTSLSALCSSLRFQAVVFHGETAEIIRVGEQDETRAILAYSQTRQHYDAFVEFNSSRREPSSPRMRPADLSSDCFVPRAISWTNNFDFPDIFPSATIQNANLNRVEREVCFGMICDQCQRTSTIQCPIEITKLDGPRKLRYKGNLKKKKIPVVSVCSPCKAYLCGSNDMIDSWPSLFWEALKGPQKVSIYEYLPVTLRESWAPLKIKTGKNPVFKDFSKDLDDWSALYNENTVKSLKIRLEKYWRCNVKCPSGADIFFSDAKKIKFEDFIVIRTGYKISPTANGSTLIGMRPDFPSPYISDIGVEIMGGFVIDEKLGPSILASNKSFREEMVFMPQNPSLKAKFTNYVDELATLTVTPNVIYKPQNRKYNKKTYAFDGIGGFSGVSTTHIGPMRFSDLNSPMDVSIAVAEGIALEHRKDLKETIIARDKQYGESRVEETEDWMKSTGNLFIPSAEVRRDCIRGSTNFLMSDLFTMRSILEKEYRNANEQLEKRRSISEYFLKIIHPMTKHGHTPYNALQKLGKTSGHYVAVAVAIFVHVRRLYFDSVKQIQNEESRQLDAMLRTCLAVTGQGRNTGKDHLRNVFLALKKVAEEKLSSVSRVDHTFMKVSVLLQLSKSCSTKLYEGQDMLQPSTKVFVLHKDAEKSRRSGCRNSALVPPWQIGDHLLMALTTDDDCTVLYFRWTPESSFWRLRVTGKCEFEAVENLILPENWSLAVYAVPVKSDMIEDDILRSMDKQRHIRCPIHGTFLNPSPRLPRTVTNVCWVQNCARRVSWRCNSNMHCIVQCSAGVCHKHYEDAKNGVNVDLVPPQFRSMPRTEETIVEEVDQDSIIQAGEREELSFENHNPIEISLGDLSLPFTEEVYALGANQISNFEDERITHNARGGILPLYDVNGASNLKFHIFLNQGFDLLRRRSQKTYMANRTREFIKHFVTVGSHPCQPLLIPESLTHPTLFWYGESDIVPGAIPSLLLQNFGGDNRPRGVADISSHVRNRLFDSSLPRNLSYWNLLFDIF